MQINSPNWVQYTILVLAVILVIGSFTWMAPVVKVNEQKVDLSQLDIPTAEEIASQIDIDNSKIDDLHNVMFGRCRTELKDNAESVVLDEIDIDELKEYIEDQIADFDKFTKIPTLDEDETEVTINQLGYCIVFGEEFGDEKDDKSAIVNLVYNFEYEDENSYDVHKDKLYITGTVDFEEGDFDDEDVELSYSL